MKYDWKKPLKWCRECEWIGFEDDPASAAEFCPHCRSRTLAIAQLSSADRHTFKVRYFMRRLRALELHGFSPGGAAQRLGCHRTMVDKLVDMGVLEKTVFDEDGTYMCFISERSIRAALKLKSQTGKWTGGKDRESV